MPGPNRLAPPRPPNTPTLDAFVNTLGKLAQQHGIAELIIIGRDPQTGEARLYGADTAIASLRDVAAAKFGLEDVGETGWG